MTASTSTISTSNAISQSTVVNIEKVSPTVKLFTLEVPGTLRFEAGQWLDVFIPGLETVGGYSIASAPHSLTSTSSFIELAVKNANHPPAKRMHEWVEVGTELGVRVGGEVVLVKEPETPALFVAGGIGVAPLHSMILEHLKTNTVGSDSRLAPTVLLYSVTSPNEILFANSLTQLAREHSSFSVHLFFSRLSQTDCDQNRVTHDRLAQSITPGRINKNHINEVLHRHSFFADEKDPRAYLCGPPQMVDDIQAVLLAEPRAFLANRVHYERWW